MISLYLIIPLYLIGIISIILNNYRYNYLFIVLSIISALIFSFLAIDNQYFNLSTSITGIKSSLASTEIVFITTFLMGMFFVLIQPKSLKPNELGLLLIYFASSIAAIFSTNLIYMLVFWEILSLSGSMIVSLGQVGSNLQSNNSGIRYFIIHLISGSCLLVGIAGYYFIYNSLSIDNFYLNNIYSYFMLAGILINIGIPPLSSWLINGYSSCSPISAIFLSIYTTKTAFFILITMFFGFNILIYIGIILVVYSIFFCLIETNIRKVLGYAIIHQLGLAIIAISQVNNSIDAGIVTSYVYAGVYYKIIFFMIVAILINSYKTTNLYILSRSINAKSPLGILLIIASLQALGAPFTSGFISKNHISNLVENLPYTWMMYFWLISSAAVSLNVGIKIPYSLLNFRNTAHNIDFQKGRLSLFAFALLVLQTSFFYPSFKLINQDTILHSLEIILMNIAIFLLAQKLLCRKERKIFSLIQNFSIDVKSTIYATLKHIMNINYTNNISLCGRYIYSTISKIPYNKYADISIMVFSLLIIFIILYGLIFMQFIFTS